jgi:hypothetical protein
MTVSEISQDGAVLVRALADPRTGLSLVAGRRRAGLALVLATAASLASAAVIVPRVDYGADAQVEAKEGEEPTPAQREEAALTALKVGQLRGWAGAALLPSVEALGAAVLLLLAFRLAGTRPGFRATFAVAAHGMLPLWLAGLLAVPAAIARAPIPPAQAGRLLPSSLAALLPYSASPPLVAALSALDLFTLLSLGLIATGMARAANASRTRAFTVTAVLFLAGVALQVALAAALGASPAPRPH